MSEKESTYTSTDQDAKEAGTAGKKADSSKTSENKTYTEDEVNKIVEKRLARERRKYSELIGGADDDREADLIAREKAITIRELKADASAALAAAGLPVTESLGVLDYTDKEACDASIEQLKKIVQAATDSRIGKILKGGAPIKKAPQGSKDQIAEAFKPPRIQR